MILLAVLWDRRKNHMGLIGLVSGFLSSFIGIGGGSLIGPLLIQLNLHPKVVNVTNTALTLFRELLRSVSIY